jgi:hypothetical protein
LTVSKSTKATSVGGKIIAALLMVVLLSVLIPTRGAEVARSNDQLRACQDNAAIVAAVGQSLVLEISKAAVYLTHPEEETYFSSHTVLVCPHRGPPVLS